MSTNDWFMVLVPIAVAFLASLPGLLAYWDKNKKTKERVDAVKSLSDLVDKQAEDWQEQRKINHELIQKIDDLTAEVECWRDVFKRWQAGIRLLIDQVVSLGREPVWKPGDDDLDCLKNNIAKGIKK